MEVIGFVASIGTLIQGAAYIRKTLKDYKNGGNDRKRLLTELDHLQSTLNRLQTDYDRARRIGSQDMWLDHLNQLSCKGGIFERIGDIISEIKSKIEPRPGLRGKVIQWTWPFVQEDVDRNVRQIQHLSHSVSLALQNASLSLTFAVHERVTRIDATANKRELKAILGWLSPLNFLEQQQLEFLKAVSGTCEWFLSTPEYIAWTRQEHQVLYCSAIGGAGKTILASVVTDDLRARTAGQDAGIFTIYCKHDKPDTHSPNKLSMTILRQLIQIKLGLIPSDIEEMLMHHYYTKDTRPSLEESTAIVNAHLPTFSATYIVVDGLDEITDEVARKEVIAYLTNLQGRPSVMFTSRPIDAIERIFIEPTAYSTGWDLLAYDQDLDSPHAMVETNGGSLKSSIQDPVEELGVQIDDQSTLYETDQQASCYRCGTMASGLHYSCAECKKTHSVICGDCFRSGSRCLNGKANHDVCVEMQVFGLKVDVSARPAAIRTYVRRRIQQSPVLHKFTVLKPDLYHEIVETVTEAAQKMFLLARLHMDTVSNPELLKYSEVRSALGNLPTALYDSYDQTMVRVQGHGKSLLRLVAWTYRPLNIREIEHALAILPEADSILQDEIIPASTLISKCAGLIGIDANNEIVFSHYSIANYFADRRDYLFGNGHDYMAEICINYLNLREFRGGSIEGAEEGTLFDKRLEEYPLFAYASVFWAQHARLAGDERILELSYHLITHSECRQAMVQGLWFSTDETTAEWYNRTSASPMHISVYFEYNQLVVRLIQDGKDIDARDESGMTPLLWAAQTGNVEIVKILIQEQVATDTRNNEGENVLHVAISRRMTAVALFLIDHTDIDINMVSGKVGRANSRTALMQAIINDDLEVVEKLLTREHLSLDLQDYLGLSAVDHAAQAENPKIIEALIKHPSFQIDRHSRQGRPPLIEAATFGRTHAVKALLDAGADINIIETKPCLHGTALMRAADYDYDEVVRELLAKGADWSITDALNRNAAHSAAINGSDYALQVLLESTKINFDLQDVNGNTPMHDAAERSHGDQALKLLLGKGAKTNILNKRGKTPLDIARARGMSRNVSTIISYIAQNSETTDDSSRNNSINDLDLDLFGAAQTGNMNAIDWHLALIEEDPMLEVDEKEDWTGSTALHLASSAGHVEVMTKLIEAGANINIQDKYGHTALHLAVRRRHIGAVQCLLEHGADTTIKNMWGDSVMAMGRATNLIRILLLEHGAEVPESQDIQQYLHAAAILGKLKVVQSLVKAGANVQSKDDYGRSPYENAKKAGNTEVAKYLDSIKVSTVASDPRPPYSRYLTPPMREVDDKNLVQLALPISERQSQVATSDFGMVAEKQDKAAFGTVEDHEQGYVQLTTSLQHRNRDSRTPIASSHSSFTTPKTEHYIIVALLLLVLWLSWSRGQEIVNDG